MVRPLSRSLRRIFVQVQASREDLESKLHKAFDVTAEPGSLHKLLAAMETIPLYVTTNYDDLLERALEPRRPNVLVDRLDKGLTIKTDSGAPELIDRTGSDLRNRLTDPETGKPTAPILFKMHGSVDRKDRINDSYLITEEDYVDYLGRDQGRYVPPYIEELMRKKNFLFLGYSLEDWNVRVILRKLLESMPSGAGDSRGRSPFLGDRPRPQRGGAEGLAKSKSERLSDGFAELHRTTGGGT